ncbi:ATP-binding protein [Flavobacterium sp. LB3P45]|uniref:ATP-binding protein n=1 Tax=Flavobacterium fructosi TaxID=3230416 RepID=A0ABW6HLT2_9FLAO
MSVTPNPIKKQASLMREHALNNFNKKNFNGAFYYFNKSKITFEIIKDSANIAYNLIQMASIQQINGDYYGSKETLTDALPYIQNDNNYLTAANNFFGIADKELSNYNDAIFYYNEAINDSKDLLSKQAPLNNIAVVYIQQKKYDKAIKVLKSILNKKILDSESLVESKARVVDNLGFAYFKKGMAEKGLALMKEGIKMRNLINDSYGGIESNLHLAEYYAKIDFQKSNQYAKTAYQTATKFNSIDERLKALSFIISNDFGSTNVQYVQKYIFLNDSIIKIRNNFKNKFAKIKYDAKKEKDENQKLRLEKAENLLYVQKVKYQRIVFAIGIIFLVILILYMIRYFRNKNRIEKIQTSYSTEIRIAKKLHDELANDVYHTISFAETKDLMLAENKEQLLVNLDAIYKRTRNISGENSNIDTGDKFEINLKAMLSNYSGDTINVILKDNHDINWLKIQPEKKIAVYRVLQELMVNMKKHSQCNYVIIGFETLQKFVQISYSDNGIGFSKTIKHKNGLQNAENRIKGIKGTFTFDSELNKGIKAKILFPK